ncbi:hypothetical protein Nmel_006123 [Mimus melanotis]
MGVPSSCVLGSAAPVLCQHCLMSSECALCHCPVSKVIYLLWML